MNRLQIACFALLLLVLAMTSMAYGCTSNADCYSEEVCDYPAECYPNCASKECIDPTRCWKK